MSCVSVKKFKCIHVGKNIFVTTKSYYMGLHGHWRISCYQKAYANEAKFGLDIMFKLL